MTKQLPPLFRDKMIDLLGEEGFELFLASYDQPRSFGLRVNTGKIMKADFLDKSPFALEPVPWALEGFYYEEGERPGKHPYYHTGLYYIQEPSAMAPVELLQVQPGEKVLDLCAAPGGKSTQIAAKLQGEGVLVVNDNHSDRVKALVKNLELFGVRNAVVLNERPERMLNVFQGYFDKILIDAPCSGEGMFRKEEDMMQQWELHTVQEFAVMQRELLGQAAQMLAPGGTILYSTCTFSPEENEAQIAEFLDNHPTFEVVPVEHFDHGQPNWLREPWCEEHYSDRAREAVAGTARLWPHRLRGEGHYVAVLRCAVEGVGADVGEIVKVDAGGSARADAGVRAMADAGVRAMADAGVRAMADAGVKAMADAGVRAMADAGVKAMADAGVKAMADAGVRAMADAGVRAMADAGVRAMGDAGVKVMADAGVKAMVDAGVKAMADAGVKAMADAGVKARTDAGAGRGGRDALRGKGRAGTESRVSLEPLQAFEDELLRSEPFAASRLVCYGEHAYASPAGLPELHGLKVVRPGWYIGALHRGRFEPSHALAMGLRMREAKRALSLASSDERALRYLKGETLEVAESEIIRDPEVIKAAKGYCLVCIDDHPVGWGKWLDGMLKNEYPPGWRWT